MSDAACHVLFLCTGNSARSILAEASLEREGAPGFRGFSAGSQPKGAPHPMALAILAERGFETDGLRSKSWDEFARPGAPRIDLVVTAQHVLGALEVLVEQDAGHARDQLDDRRAEAGDVVAHDAEIAVELATQIVDVDHQPNRPVT